MACGVGHSAREAARDALNAARADSEDADAPPEWEAWGAAKDAEALASDASARAWETAAAWERYALAMEEF